MGTTPTAKSEPWDLVASDWDRYREHVERSKEPLTARMLAQLDLRPGLRVLEVGAGAGTLALRIASLVGDENVVATDVSPAMVEVARRTLAAHPATTVEYADLADLDAYRSSFDAVVCRMGLMFLPDPAAGAAQLAPALRPGGRLSVAVWAGPEHNPWLTAVGMSAMAAGLPVTPPFGPGGPFSLADPDVLAGMLADQGLAEVSVEPIDLVFVFADAATHVAVGGSLAPNLGPALASATENELAAVVEGVEKATEPFRCDAGRHVPGRALLATARR